MLKRYLLLLGVLVIALAVVQPLRADCIKIKDGFLRDRYANLLTLGYDQWGYNYQAHMFNGLYENFSRPDPPVTESDTNLIMKWSDDWLSNMDCNGDGDLDRGGSTDTGISRGWLTNHMEGDYLGDDAEYHHWTYFVKIVWVGPAPLPPESDPWAGKRIWGEYAIIEEVTNDPYAGLHGVDRSRLVNPAGFGYYTH